MSVFIYKNPTNWTQDLCLFSKGHIEKVNIQMKKFSTPGRMIQLMHFSKVKYWISDKDKETKELYSIVRVAAIELFFPI